MVPTKRGLFHHFLRPKCLCFSKKIKNKNKKRRRRGIASLPIDIVPVLTKWHQGLLKNTHKEDIYLKEFTVRNSYLFGLCPEPTQVIKTMVSIFE